MILDHVGDRRRLLSYCTNVHPGESLAEVQASLTRWAVPLRARFCDAPEFALGLRLGEAAVRELDESSEALASFRAFLDEHGFVAYTLNVFPQGAFHADVVKENVYLPDWSDASRANYTMAAARVLARLLPDEDRFGTMSTVPLGWVAGKSVDGVAALANAGAHAIAEVAHGLARLEDDTGKRIQLCLEPEPLCAIENSGEAESWFKDSLWPKNDQLPAIGGVSGEEQLRRHVGLCFDACHHAVEHEDVLYAMERLQRAGVPVGKIQLSCALEVRRPNENKEGLARLMAFDEPRFLHQVIARDDRHRLVRFEDLGAFAAFVEDGSTSVDVARCHFHVPIHVPSTWPLHTTQPALRDLMFRESRRRSVPHLEVETYTFDVMPGVFGRESTLVDSLERELQFARRGLLGPTDG